MSRADPALIALLLLLPMLACLLLHPLAWWMAPP